VEINHTTADTVEAIWRYPVKSMQGEELQAADVTQRGLVGDRAYALVEKATNRAAVVRTWAAGLMNYYVQFDKEPQPNQPPPTVRITGPDGVMHTSSEPDIDVRLSATFDRELSLMSQAPAGLLVEFPAGTLGGNLAELTEAPLAGNSPEGTFFDLACVNLIATSSLDQMRSVYPRGKIDVRRFRPNIVVRTLEAPFVENTWVGRRIAIGNEVILKVIMPCPRCVNVTLPQPGLPRDGGLLRAIAQHNTCDLGDFGKLPCLGVYADVIQTGRIRHGDILRWLDPAREADVRD
jgi:uncharacterized protein